VGAPALILDELAEVDQSLFELAPYRLANPRTVS
jgi:hypothetical protein